jgi:hypothetical protein
VKNAGQDFSTFVGRNVQKMTKSIHEQENGADKKKDAKTENGELKNKSLENFRAFVFFLL